MWPWNFVEILEYTEGDAQDWDEYVMNHPEGRFCHLTGFMRALEETYGYQPSYWLFKDQGETIGVIPLFLHRGFLRNRLLSQPASEYGGPLFANKVEIDVQMLKAHLFSLLDRTGARFLEIHGGMGMSQELRQKLFREKPLHQYGVLSLADQKHLWHRKLDHSVRKAINKAGRSGLRCYEETSPAALERRFYPLYLRAMRKFGTPPHPPRFYLNLHKNLSRSMRLFLVDYKDKTVACLLGFTTGRRVQLVWTASTDGYLSMRPNDLAHWAFICWSTTNGFESFDFGPIRYPGQRRYKEKWGAELRDYSYYYFPAEASCEPSFEAPLIFRKLWRHLPLKISERLGPHVRRAVAR